MITRVTYTATTTSSTITFPQTALYACSSTHFYVIPSHDGVFPSGWLPLPDNNANTPVIRGTIASESEDTPDF